jgi:hypothetical protein
MPRIVIGLLVAAALAAAAWVVLTPEHGAPQGRIIPADQAAPQEIDDPRDTSRSALAASGAAGIAAAPHRDAITDGIPS